MSAVTGLTENDVQRFVSASEHRSLTGDAILAKSEGDPRPLREEA